jgi:hypothetical protein
MTLIYEEFIKGYQWKFFEGMDFEISMKHPKDGSDGFLVFLIDNWEVEIKKQRRQNKINTVLTGKKIKTLGFEDINNTFVCVYQKSGIENMEFIEIIKKKTLNLESVWNPVGSIGRGFFNLLKRENNI